MSSSFKNMKFMQRAAQGEGKTEKILENIVSDMNSIFYSPPKRCVVVMEGDPHPPLRGRLFFDPEPTGTRSTPNNGRWKRKRTGEDYEVLYPNKLQRSIRANLMSGASSSRKGVRLSEETLAHIRKLYVGGIPFHSSQEDVWSYFIGCGTITSLHCMISPKSGNFLGIAIIRFKTTAAAKRALALDGSDMDGLPLKIRPIVKGYNTIFMGNLSWEITEDDLRNLFSECTITSIRFAKDKETGECKGYGHVDFADSESLKTALKLDQYIVCGRPIRICRDVPMKGATVAPVSWKIKPRKCFMCGEMGHISSACLLKQPISEATNREITGSTPFQQKTISNQLNSEDSRPAQPRCNGTNEVTPVLVSSKIMYRTCYVCKEKDHTSSSCPKKQSTDQAISDQIKNEGSKPHEPNTNFNQPRSDGSNVVAPVPVSWKIKPRRCFLRGEMGHVASACLLEQPTSEAKNREMIGSVPCQQKTITNQLNSEDSRPDQPRCNGTNEVTPVPVSAEIAHRICYVCKEKDHISSACPKKQSTDQAISSQIKREGSKIREPNTNFNRPRSDGTNVVAPVPVSWKIKPRKCFMCGEMGHISSACLLERPTGEAKKRKITGFTPFQEKSLSYQFNSVDSRPPQPRRNGTNEVMHRKCYRCKKEGHIASACQTKRFKSH